MAVVNIASPGRSLANLIIANPPGSPNPQQGTGNVEPDKPLFRGVTLDPIREGEPDAGVRVKDDVIS